MPADADLAPDPTAPSTGARGSRRLATGAVLLALVVAAFESTVVTSAMPTIAADLGGLDVYAWVFSAFLLASMVGILVCGKLADALGRRPVFVAGMALFLLGSALCGGAQSIAQLVAFRVVQGLGAGAIQPIAMTISADLYTLRERVRVQTLFTAAWGAANALGPLLGGWIVMHASWRWVFFVNLPVGALTVALLVASYRDPPRGRRGPAGAGGAVLAGGAAALSLLALTPGEGGLGGGARAAVGLAAVAAGVALVLQQRRADEPILPASLLPDAVVRAGVAGGVFAGALLYACTAYVPLWLTQQHQSALTAGAALVPLLVGWAVGSTFGVHVLVRWGMRASVGGGFAIAAAGAAALAGAAIFGLGPAWAFAALALLGLGLGPAASTSLVAPQSHVAWRYRGMITSVIYASRMLGGSIAVAALGAGGAGGVTPAWRFTAILGMALAALATIAALAPTRLDEAAPASG
jgi:Major Facilitator Superfamily